MKLPEHLKQKKKIILCFSILVTGRCNANCSYCHYFAANPRDKIMTDISDELFDCYCKLIKMAKNILPKNIEVQCRFSGGEPTILGDRLFDLADRVYKATGIRPYVLTNGALLDDCFIEKAKVSKINHFYVSMENPLEVDSGSFDFYQIAAKVKKYNSEKLPIIPAVTIIANDQFENLFKIAKIFYEEIGCLPTFNELSYGKFQPPTKRQLQDLRDNVIKVVKFFKDKTPIKIFPYVSPELSYGTAEHYIAEVDFLNKYQVDANNIDEKLFQILNRLDIDYPKYDCRITDCDWYGSCSNLKWVWTHGFDKLEIDNKLKSYCLLKKTLNQAFYDALATED